MFMVLSNKLVSLCFSNQTPISMFPLYICILILELDLDGNALQTLNIVVSHARCNKCLDGQQQCHRL